RSDHSTNLPWVSSHGLRPRPLPFPFPLPGPPPEGGGAGGSGGVNCPGGAAGGGDGGGAGGGDVDPPDGGSGGANWPPPPPVPPPVPPPLGVCGCELDAAAFPGMRSRFSRNPFEKTISGLAERSATSIDTPNTDPIGPSACPT